MPVTLEILRFIFFLYAGLSDLMTEVLQDFSSKPINSLCSMDNQSSPINFIHFELAKPLCSIPLHYYFLSDKCHSNLFQQIWKSKLDEILRAMLPLTLKEIVTKIWDPVFLECCKLVDSVKEGSIKLKKVDFYFRQFEVGTTVHQLKNLYMAVELCRDIKAEDFGFIQRSVNLMARYWALCKQVTAANVILELIDKLKLVGNFESFQDVASSVNTSMMDAPLESIGCKSLKDTKSFLDKVTEGKNLECLKQFAACSNIVEWIKNETKG